MKHLLIILISFLLLSSPVNGQSDEKCYVVVESSKDIDPSLLSNISISLISKFLRDVEQLPPSGISLDSCQYNVSVSKNDDTTFVTFKGEGLNSYGDSKLTGSDGFQQSILKSLYRSLKDKRDIICQDYGKLLEECNEIVKRYIGVLFGTYNKTKWEDGGEWIWYENDDDDRFGRFKGDIENGLPNGQGEVKTTSGEKYVGEWKDGRQNGQGIMNFPIGAKYEGEWKDDKREGQGTFIFPDGKKYVGKWTDGEANGQGTSTYPDGGKYVGEFKDGKRQGQGTYIYSGGDKYVGEFKNDEEHGQGTYTWSDGGKYVGEWKDGKKDGQGKSIFSNGNQYAGKWKNNEMHGQGTYTMTDGRKFVGESKDGGPWNMIAYEINGNIQYKIVNGEYTKQ